MVYVNYGCGFTIGEGWLNFDNSPTLRFERIPFLGRFYTKNEKRFPEEVIYGDIVKGPLCGPDEADGVFANHVLEHLSYSDCLIALKYTYTMLKPSSIFRLVVPDFEIRAKQYIKDLLEYNPKANENFLTSCNLGVKERPRTIMSHLSHLFGGSAHLWMWDELSMNDTLKSVGFVKIRRCEFGDCEDPMFNRVEEEGRFVGSMGKELAMECEK